jgi:hypothetical protein
MGGGSGSGKLQLLLARRPEAHNPEENGLDILYTRYILRNLQHRRLIRNTSLDLQQDRGLPVVQFHDLVIFHNSRGECLLIVGF